jgi:glycosyltransferase involved in cell wall biosynthesis
MGRAMKILQVNVVYPHRSTGKIVHAIHEQLLKEAYESVVCYGRGDLVSEPHIHKVAPEWILRLQSLRSRLTGFAYSGCLYSTRRLLQIIRKEKPDVVHLHCLNGYFVNIYKLLHYLKKSGIPTVLTLHAEFMYTAGCGHAYDCEKWKTGCGNCPQLKTERPHSWFFDQTAKEWKQMQKAFAGFDSITICPVSDWLKDRAMQSPFMRDKHFETVTNGIDTALFQPVDFHDIQKTHQLHGEKVILHVTPDFLSENKGGKYVLEIAVRMLQQHIKIIIVGFNGDKSILPENVIPVPHTANALELAAYYSMANVTLITSKKETFSMVCAESLCCGTPVVGFQAGAPERICLTSYSEFVEQGNVDELENAIHRFLYHKAADKAKMSDEAKLAYSSRSMYEKYKHIYGGESLC